MTRQERMDKCGRRVIGRKRGLMQKGGTVAA